MKTVRLPLLVLTTYFCFQLAFGQLPTVSPSNNQFIAVNSPDNVTYSCTVTAPRSVVWEVGRSQIRGPDQFGDVADIGIYIDPMDTASQTSTITISQMARQQLSNSDILVLCLSIEGINSIGGEPYRVVTVPAPNAPGNLVLVPSDPTLTLEWDRPTNVPIQVQVNYTVEINSTDPNSELNFRNMTAETFLSVHFLEELLIARRECVMFEFSVSGENIAGPGELARIIDTVPISPDVTNISKDLTVQTVNLRPLQVEVSFPPVIPCSSNFPLRNYTVNVNNQMGRFFTPNEVPLTNGLITLTLPMSNLPGVVEDSSNSLTVTACNDVTCKTSSPATFYTTDVQRAEAVFFENRLFLRCSFAGNSQARGCAIILTLSGTNETERFEVNAVSGGSNSLCTMADNQRDAYRSVEAVDIEMNGSDGILRLEVTTTVLTTEEEYIATTRCRQPTDNRTAVVGGIVGGVLALVIIITIIVIAVVGVYLGWWCACLDMEELKHIMHPEKEEDMEAATPLNAPDSEGKRKDEEKESSPQAASHDPLVQTDAGRQTSLTSMKPKTVERKLTKNKYLVVPAKHLKKIVEEKVSLLTGNNEPNMEANSLLCDVANLI